jgi:hypothetical protein
MCDGCDFDVVLCRGIWPATLLFSPLEKYGAFSYADVMITPLAEAMRDAIVKANQINKLYTPPDADRPVVYMALQGKLLLVALTTCQAAPACILLQTLPAALVPGRS